MKILETIMVGDDDECSNMSKETCEYLGINLDLFKEMAEHCALDDWGMTSVCASKGEAPGEEASYEPSWKTDPNWKLAKNITEAMKRGEGEGAETFREAKGEVDHMLHTGGMEVVKKNDPTVASDIRNTPPVDMKWVMVRKLKKCRKTGMMIYARLRMRLALRGFKQKEGVQYDKYGTFAPVMHLGSLMLILILAVLFKLHISIRVADDSKAFCEGVMDYKLYTTLPKPFDTMVKEGYAPHTWLERSRHTMAFGVSNLWSEAGSAAILLRDGVSHHGTHGNVTEPTRPMRVHPMVHGTGGEKVQEISGNDSQGTSR
jgi:hypothetical protein